MDSRRPDGAHALIQRVRALRAAAIAVALLLARDPLAAQTPHLDDYWRALRSEDDAEAVLAASAPADIHEDIAEGLRLFRAWEISGDEDDANRARELLRRARVPREQRDWHALALAMVYARGPDSRTPLNSGRDYVTDPASLASARSLRLLRGALEAKPHFVEAALELAMWAVDREDPIVAAEAEIALAAQPQTPEVLLARASLDLLLDQPAFAAQLAAQAQASGADRSVARHLRAWGLFQHERSVADAVQLYFLGATEMTGAGRVEYDRWLEPILSPEESAEWHATPNERAADWLRRYWNRNAARAGVMMEERLADHYRRVQRARVAYPNTAPYTSLQRQATYAIDGDERRFDLSWAGLMLVRHGDPFRLSRLERCAPPPRETGQIAINPPSLGLLSGPCGEWADRIAQFRALAQASRGDSYFPFVRPIDLLYGVYAFRGPDGTNDLVFAAGLPARSANALIDGPDRMSGIISAIMLTDSLGNHVRSDSAFSQPVPPYMDPLGGDNERVELVFGTLRVPAGNATREFRVSVSDADRHAGGIGSGTLSTYAFDGFSLSDIVVAPEDMPASWRRGDALIAFAPLATYAPGQTVTLYYEIYGLAEGSAYVTEVELVPPAEGVGERMLDLLRDRAVRFRFDGVADAPDAVFGVQQYRTIALDDMDAGIWTLRVRVTDAAGATAVRETTVQIER